MLWVLALSSSIEAKADLKAVEAYNEGIRMLFTENVGQLPNEVVFYSMHPSVVYVLKDGTIHINGIRVSFGAKPRFITGDMPLITRISYFGQNKAISNIPTYRRVVLKEVYPKIDAILTADGRGVVEMQFIVRPGGDPHEIKVETDGRVVRKEDGLYIVKDSKDLVKVSNLKAYQGTEEVKVNAILSGNTLRFEVGKYDERHTLVIDPIATAILASSSYDEAYTVAVDRFGNVFVAGHTSYPSDFAPSRNILGTSGGDAAFVSKLANDLKTHLATAILTSSSNDYAFSMAVDDYGNVFVAGETDYSDDFAPSRNIFGTTGSSDAFVSKLNNNLSIHIATAILTSSGGDGALSIVIDGAGNVFVAGYTYYSGNFAPSRNVFGTPSTPQDTAAFVSKLNSNLSVHIATAILTSSSGDRAYTVAVDGSGNVFVAGHTYYSNDFAPSRNVFGTTGGGDAFVSKLSNDLSTHIATAILTSSSDDKISSMAIDGAGNVFVAGYTYYSSNFAPSRNVFGTPSPGYYDVFVSKLSNDVSTHIATAILSSSRSDHAFSVRIDNYGYVFVAGETSYFYDFAPERIIFGDTGLNEAFVSKLNNNLSAHMATAILASSGVDEAYAITVDGTGNVFAAGYTSNPTSFSQSRNIFGTVGSGDAFVSKLPNVLNVSEKPITTGKALVSKARNGVIFTLPTSAYVGFDAYSADGRLIKRVSLGYLPAGKYEYRLKLPKGAYLLKVRVGNEVKTFKGIM